MTNVNGDLCVRINTRNVYASGTIGTVVPAGYTDPGYTNYNSFVIVDYSSWLNLASGAFGWAAGNPTTTKTYPGPARYGNGFNSPFR